VGVAIGDGVHPTRVGIDVERGGFEGTAIGIGWRHGGEISMGVVAECRHVLSFAIDILRDLADRPIRVVGGMQSHAIAVVKS